MHIGSGLNTVSSMYRQQKGNNMKAPVSAENTFYTAETPKVYQIFTTDNMLWTGGNGTGLSYCLKYADDSTDENPVVLAKGVDENGKEFELCGQSAEQHCRTCHPETACRFSNERNLPPAEIPEQTQ